ncbi:MAG: hypothetical protein AAGF49_10085 [Pseudomonadota bacterium]
MPLDRDRFRKALETSWSLASSTLWRADNPAAGQCGVSALVAQDHLGGDILKTRYGSIWHFYNRIDGERVDFTKAQFDAPITYDDIPSNRDEAFADTNAEQYAVLGGAVARQMKAP